MPLYTYKCPSCYQTIEILQSIKEPSPVCKKCVEASCGTYIPEMERMWKKTGKPQFKGSGFYETDYKNPKPKPAPS